jgi:uncharacterized protein (TIGR02300 family)
MPAKDLGTKHACYKCGTKFYDLKKPEPICPKCGADQRESPALKAPPERRARGAPKPAPVEEVEAPEAASEEAEEADDVEADDEEEPAEAEEEP